MLGAKLQISDLASTISAQVKPNQRYLVAVAGAPASGKSTMAEALASEIGENAAIVPMDGFHLDNAILKERGDLPRKGAPHTFDINGFLSTLSRIRSEEQVYIPVFDRDRDLAISGAQIIDRTHNIILVEGAYLLLDQEPWSNLANLWDLEVWLDVPLEVLQKRLIERWVYYGHSPEKALSRAMENDIPNVKMVTGHSRAAQIVVQNF